MFNEMRSYFRRLAEGCETGSLATILCPVTEVISKIYHFSVRTVRALYEKKILKRKRLPFPVVSVGNLTWGGTGKTPVVEYLARRVGERRRNVLILTRGYSHDEINQMKHHLPHVGIGVGKNRYRVGKRLGKKTRYDLAILDDGFQHFPIERDIEIITVNCLNPFGNGKLIPRGILREPVSVLQKAAIIVMTHVNLVRPKELQELKTRLQSLAPEAFIVESYLEPLFFYRAKKRSRVSISKLQNQRVTTFSAVGVPRSFQLLLSQYQIRPIRNFEFTDHHQFSKGELEEIKEISASASASEIITTEKDFYRCPDLITETLNPLVLATRLRIASGEEVLTDRLFHLLGVTPRW
ncbi:MAG: tetraacyldisaccharide 4'-kinase [Candidatus Omnitrophica bacterium]|nr:tetraacyldisaccharide 4'-kinase [Candidatus Omnitrophota bacterium]